MKEHINQEIGSNHTDDPSKALAFNPPMILKIYAMVFRVLGVLYGLGMMAFSVQAAKGRVFFLILFGLFIAVWQWEIADDLIKGRRKGIGRLGIWTLLLVIVAVPPLIFGNLPGVMIVAGNIIAVCLPPLFTLWRLRSSLADGATQDKRRARRILNES
jgi:hypothetical protein